MTPPATLRGLDIRVAQDVDDALDSVEQAVEEEVPARTTEAAPV
jgi:SSS family solute:Na+ symporter